MTNSLTDHLSNANAELQDDAQTTAIWVGRLSPQDCVAALRLMALEVANWHANQRLHRAIQFEALHWPRDAVQPKLHEPSQDPIEFGGPFANQDLCPPELRGSRTVAVPCLWDEAQRALTEHGALMVPGRIDVYQLGSLLCRLVCGKAIRAYLSSPATMSRVPKLIRTVIDRCIGYDESNRIESVAELIELLDAVLQAQELSHEAAAAALNDSALAANAATRPVRRVPAFQSLGHFEVLEEIGHGGMGVVYRGYDRSLDRAVALKVLHPRFATDGSFVKRFKAEAAAAAKLNHPHLVPIYFIGEDSGRHFFAMQFINGESLAERLHRVGRLTRDEVLAVMQQVLLGLAAAHKQGFVHRDIKPGNILLDRENGSALLTDFGLACGPVTDEPTESNLVMGTAEYMSPEQAQGGRIDARSDLYSVGVVLYQLLSGHTPFETETPSSQMIRHVCDQPLPLAQVAPEVDWQLVKIVDRLLKKRPEDRYQSVEEVLIDFQQLPGQQPALTIGAATSDHFQSVDVARPRKQRLWMMAIAALVAIVALWAARPVTNARSAALAPHADPIWALSFSADGHYLISGGGRTTSLKDAGDTALRLWDTASGQMLKQSEPLPIGPERLVPIDTAQRILSLSSAREGTGTLVVWDLQTNQQESPRFADPFAFHFDAAAINAQSVLAVGNHGLTELNWQNSTGSMTQRVLQSSAKPFRTIAVASDARPLLCFVSVPTDTGDFVVKYEGSKLRESQRWHVDGTIHSMAIGSNGDLLLTRHTSAKDRDVVTAWDTSTKKARWSKRGYEAARPGLAINRDARRLITIAESVVLRPAAPEIKPLDASASQNQPQAAVVLDAATGQEICRLTTGSRQLRAVAITPDGSLAAIGDEQGRVVFSRLPVARRL